MPPTMEEEELGELKGWRWVKINGHCVVSVLDELHPQPEMQFASSIQPPLYWKVVSCSVWAYWRGGEGGFGGHCRLHVNDTGGSCPVYLCTYGPQITSVLVCQWWKGVLMTSTFLGSVGWKGLHWRRSKAGEGQECKSENAWSGGCAAPNTGPQQRHAQTPGATQVVLTHPGTRTDGGKWRGSWRMGLVLDDVNRANTGWVETNDCGRFMKYIY